MKKMRVESLEPLIPTLGEKECVRRAFEGCDETVESFGRMGIEVEPIEIVILNGKEYSRCFLNDD